MSKIPRIGSNISDINGFNLHPANSVEVSMPAEVFTSDYKGNSVDSTSIEKEDYSPEIEKTFKFLSYSYNEDFLNDEILLVELDDIKDSKMDLSVILDNFRINSEKGGLLNYLDKLAKSKKIKQSTVNKYKKYFTEELEKYFCFDKKHRSMNETYDFRYKKYRYKSDNYNVIQKNENILEIENLTTKEKRTINFEKILPNELNGIQDIIALKASIQNLPAEILFQIPEEISFIFSLEALRDMTLVVDTETNEIKSNADDIEGNVSVFTNGMESFISNSSPDTLIHEIAHAIFFNNKGKDTLEDNEELVKIFNNGVLKFSQENNYSSEIDGYPEQAYWSKSVSELGAEIITAVFTNNKEVLDSIDKYAPGSIDIVLSEFRKRFNAEDKHNKTDVNSYIKYIIEEH